MKFIIIEKLKNLVISSFTNPELFILTNDAGDVIASFASKEEAKSYAQLLENNEAMDDAADEKRRSDAFDSLTEYELTEEDIKKYWKGAMEAYQRKYSLAGHSNINGPK